MAFTVRLGDGTQDCGDDDVYDFIADGVLVLHYSEPGKWSQYYAQGEWKRIDAAPNHRPGEPLDRSIGPDFDD
jgi:hypothetical protein